MMIPDYSRSDRTDPEYPPNCTRLNVVRKSGPTFCSTLTLAWEVSEEHITKVAWPPQLQAERTRILQAYEGKRPAFTVKEDPNVEVEVALATKVGTEEAPVCDSAVGIARRVSIAVSKGVCSVVWLLRVEHPRELGSALLDCIGSDVLATTTANETIPGTDRSIATLDEEAAKSMVLSDDGDVLPPEPDNGKPVRRRRGGVEETV